MARKSKVRRGGSKPLMKFPNLEEFITRHEDATIAEFDGEAQRIQEFNDKELRFKAAVITAPSASQPYQSHVLRVDLSAETGSVVQKMEIGELRFVNGRQLSSWCTCRKGGDTVALNNSWGKYTELIVYVPPADARNFGGYLAPNLGENSTNPENLRSDKGARWIYIQLRLQASRVTIDTELRAVRRLVDGVASQAGSEMFSYLMKFESPKRTVDLFQFYPQFADLNLIRDANVRLAMRGVIQGFDQDQSQAYKSLSTLPEGVRFIPGGPGAGKTRYVGLVT